MKRGILLAVIFLSIFLIMSLTLAYEQVSEDYDSSFRISSSEYFLNFLRGDANQDAKIDLSDVVFSLNHLYKEQKILCMDATDANDDGRVDISDSIFLLNFLFVGKKQPPEPFSKYGKDYTEDELNCNQYKPFYASFNNLATDTVNQDSQTLNETTLVLNKTTNITFTGPVVIVYNNTYNKTFNGDTNIVLLNGTYNISVVANTTVIILTGNTTVTYDKIAIRTNGTTVVMFNNITNITTIIFNGTLNITTIASSYLSSNGLSLIACLEGFRLNPYNDAAGHCTVGFGEKLHNGPCDGTEESVTEEEAKETLKENVKEVEDQLLGDNGLINSEIQNKLTQEQCDAIISLVFNVGAGNFGRSRALQALNACNFENFVFEAFDPQNGFVKAGGKVNEGLQNRRERERKLFQEGDYGDIDC